MTFPRSSTLDWNTDSDDDIDSMDDDDKKGSNIIAANFLPILQRKSEETGKWCFDWDKDSLFFHLKDSFPSESKVVYVGLLKTEVECHEREEVTQTLFTDFKCVPVFIDQSTRNQYYHGFCKQRLWPLLHYMLPVLKKVNEISDPSYFLAYVKVNNIFADRVMDVIRSKHDSIWIHDYHLMLLPTFLRKRINAAKLGFFLHSPFPSSEIYTALPKREEILKGLLNVDLIGFQTYDNARHFLSCCKRMLGIDHECCRGYIGVKYCGRTIIIKILPVGIHLGHIKSVLNHSSTIGNVREVEQKFKGMKLILGVDDMDIFKGIDLKLEGLEMLLKQHQFLRGNVVLVQILNKPRSMGDDVKELEEEATRLTKRINDTYGSGAYQPVILIKKTLSQYEKAAFYVAADCCIVNSTRDGMNLIPYEYVVCRQGTEELDRARGINNDTHVHKSTLIVSEFIGCSPSLSGAIRVNPWNTEEIAEALYSSIFMSQSDKAMQHEKHYRYVSSHDIRYWSNSFMQDLERACKDHDNKKFWPLGLGLNFRVLALDDNFEDLSIGRVLSSYREANKRVIFLDYDGTIVSNMLLDKTPGEQVIHVLNKLCSDEKNTVFIVSGRDRESLSKWFLEVGALGLAAEHGFFIRWNEASKWELSSIPVDSKWKEIAEPVMNIYTDATDGSWIESKEIALVWHYQSADPLFGSSQANELMSHLEKLLVNEPVMVKKGDHIVEIKPQGVGKGIAVEKLLRQLVSSGNAPEFVLCIGDDKSDEDMFESINACTTCMDLFSKPLGVFACTVGQKPSKAKYFVGETSDVLNLLDQLAQG